jgi:DNA-binding FadR family transcriptional regulator
VLEGFSVTAAAGGLEDDGLLSLRQFVENEAASEASQRQQTAYHFHELIAQTTGNVALTLFIQALAFLTARPRDSASATTPVPDGLGERLHQDHEEIAAAVLAGDDFRARELMLQHIGFLRETASSFRKYSRLDAEVDAMNLARAKAALGEESPRSAAAVATRIRQDIIRLGWPVGQSLGFEAELMERYGVGRAQFREAARILESHSVIQMRRGIGGGMVIAAPDTQATMRAGSLYLRYRNVQAAHIRDLREELEAASVRLTIENLSPEGTEKLHATLERERAWSDEEFSVVSHDLHGVIADLSGNRPLALLLSILMQLTAERLYSGDPQRVTEPPDAVRKAHQAIVDAIVARDVALASRRMRKHLRAVASWATTEPAS